MYRKNRIVFAKDEVECKLKCKLLITNVEKCVVENFGKEN